MTEFQEFEQFFPEELVSEEVSDYDIRRSLADFKLYSVFAVNYMNQVLYPVVVDVSFDTAVSYQAAYVSELVKGSNV